MTVGRVCSRAGGAICTTCKRTCALDNQRRTKKSSDHGLTKSAWKRHLQPAALERDHNRCRFRFRGCTRRATTVHLRTGLAGDHDAATLDDVLSACLHCHGVADGIRSSGS
jgi:hypothetical protein